MIKLKTIKQLILVNTVYLLLPSFVVQHYLGLEANATFAVSSTVCLLIVFHSRLGMIAPKTVYIILVLNFFGSVATYVSGAYSQLLMTATFSMCLLIALLGWRMFVDIKVLNHLMVLCWVIVIGAAIGFLYALSGQTPLFKLELFSRETYFYLTTFTNAVNGNLIRAAGIFDEPGALAMFITLIVALNEALGVNMRWNAALLFLGLVTGSLALFFILLAYLTIKIVHRQYIYILLISLLFISAFISMENFSHIFEKFYLNRLEIVDGHVIGDNRTQQISHFFELVDWEMTIKGERGIGIEYDSDLSSNPFSIYAGYGFIVWLPYFFLELWLLYCAFFYRPNLRFPALALFLTLLQRPYIYSVHWGLIIAVVVVTIFRMQNSTKNKPRASGNPITPSIKYLS